MVSGLGPIISFFVHGKRDIFCFSIIIFMEIALIGCRCDSCSFIFLLLRSSGIIMLIAFPLIYDICCCSIGGWNCGFGCNDKLFLQFVWRYGSCATMVTATCLFGDSLLILLLIVGCVLSGSPKIISISVELFVLHGLRVWRNLHLPRLRLLDSVLDQVKPHLREIRYGLPCLCRSLINLRLLDHGQ